MKKFIVTLLVLLQCSCASFISMRNDSVEHFFKPNISKAFIYKSNNDYYLKVVMSDYSHTINSITKAKLYVNGENIDYILNQDGLISEPFKLSSEQNVNGSIEIETRLGINNPIVSDKNLTISGSYDAEIERPVIPPSNYKYRKALVIGNAKYNNPRDVLKNPENDADNVAIALKKLGFEVTEEKNLSEEKMIKAISKFSNELKNDNEVRVFYYSGHGLKVNDENYMLPINYKRPTDNINNLVGLSDVLIKIGEYNNVLNITILDSCRDNYFSEIINDKKLISILAKKVLILKRVLILTRI